jgi:hypothetical protein
MIRRGEREKQHQRTERTTDEEESLRGDRVRAETDGTE